MLNYLKKIKYFTLLVIIAFSINHTAFAAFASNKLNSVQNASVVSVNAYADKKAPMVNALAVAVMEVSSGRILYSKNAAVKRSIASTTKIMTALVALENGSLQDEVTVSKRAASIGGSTIGLQEGEKYTLKEMLYTLLLISANDAAIAVAEHIGGTVEGFADMMNRKAKSIGAADSNFVTPHGLDRDNQYSTAYDVAIITRCALNNPIFREIVSTKNTNISGYSLYNTNELLGTFQGVDGVKTGYTGKAGRCLVTTVCRDGMRLITVVLGSPTRTARANASRALIDYVYENFSMRKLLAAGDVYAKVPVYRGIDRSVILKTAQDIEVPLSNAEMEELEIRKYVPDVINAPVYAGIEAGYVEYILKGEVVAQSMLTISENIRKMKYYDYFRHVLESWARIMKEGIFAGI